jgi:VWFA-related protein
MKSRPLFAALMATALVQPPLGAVGPQEAPPPKSQDLPTFGVATSAVTLDVVVRDKKGRAVRDLKASDFEVYEDGVLQKVESFEVFGRPLDAPAVAATAAPTTPAAPTPAAPTAGSPAPVPGSETRPQVIAFVFDRLSPDARNIALKAARVYLEKGHIQGDQVGVFAIDLALRSIQPFTTDKELIKAGLEQAATQGNTAFSDNRQRTRDLLEASATAARAAPGQNPGGGPGGGTSASSIGAAAASSALTQQFSNLQAGMLRNFEGLERDQQGYASTNGLLAVVSGLKSLPGRKTVVFFSEGLAIPSNVLAQFRSVIHNANRANVSVYAMDAGGLRALSMDQETRKEMMQAAERRMRVLDSGADDVGGPMTASLERNEDLLRLNTESGLGQLANETGGFLIRDTNDAAAAFGRIEEDMRFHYLLGYSPTNENYDGKFRSVSIKVKRSGMVV